MKKLLISAVVVCLFVFLFAANTQAQMKKKSQEMDFYLQLGGAVDDSFEYFYWTVGATLDLNLSEALMVSPEVTLLGYKFDFDVLTLYPGGTVNLKFGDKTKLFVGGGAVIAIPIAPSDGDTKLDLKLNGGFLGDKMKLTVYILTPFDDLFAALLIGANIGFAL